MLFCQQELGTPWVFRAGKDRMISAERVLVVERLDSYGMLPKLEYVHKSLRVLLQHSVLIHQVWPWA